MHDIRWMNWMCNILTICLTYSDIDYIKDILSGGLIFYVRLNAKDMCQAADSKSKASKGMIG